MRYSINDMLDRTYESQFITLNWDGEKATFESPEEAPAEEGEEGGGEKQGLLGRYKFVTYHARNFTVFDKRTYDYEW